MHPSTHSFERVFSFERLFLAFIAKPSYLHNYVLFTFYEIP